MSRIVLSLLVAGALAVAPGPARASGSAAPIPVTATQRAAIGRLTGYVTQLVGFTRTITTGIEVKTVRIRALRASIVHWSAADGSRFRGRLAPVAQLAVSSAVVLARIDDVESRGGDAAATRYRAAAVTFDLAVTRFSALRFVQRSR